MFTGIIECTSRVEAITESPQLLTYTLSAAIAEELKIGESVSHNGICLTVVRVEYNTYQVQVIDQTDRTAVSRWQVGALINVERAMRADYRFDGHMVLGHVDGRGEVESIRHHSDDIRLRITYPTDKARLMVNKGSICLQGISLTIADLQETFFDVAIIPLTWKVTNLHSLHPGDLVNLEYDIIGKYIERYMQSK